VLVVLQVRVCLCVGARKRTAMNSGLCVPPAYVRMAGLRILYTCDTHKHNTHHHNNNHRHEKSLHIQKEPEEQQVSAQPGVRARARCVHACVLEFVRASVRECMHACVCACVHARVQEFVRACVCVHACAHALMCTRTQTLYYARTHTFLHRMHKLFTRRHYMEKDINIIIISMKIKST
jgi:hypothetical protein